MNTPIIRRAQASIENSLERYLSLKDEASSLLSEAMRYAALAPGKRIRPLIVTLVAHGLGRDTDAVLPLACAVEYVHAFSLVHDDLPALDNDETRRGQPTVHVAYGEDIAVLVGDALLAKAFEVIAADQEGPPQAVCSVLEALARATGHAGMTGGQAIDTRADTMNTDFDDLRKMHELKTGSLFGFCFVAPGIVLEAPVTTQAELERVGERVGLAFQVIDDVLDVTAEKTVIGKTPGKDDARGLPTYVTVMGIEAAREYGRQLIHEATEILDGLSGEWSELRLVLSFLAGRTR